MIAAWGQRLGIAYVVLYALPGPVWALPGGEGFDAAYSAVEQQLVVPAGRWLFGVSATPVVTGSGDTTYHYVEVAVQLLLAALIATAWQLARRGQPVSPRTRDHATIVVRYVLGATMLFYGWMKLIPTQMPPPDALRLFGTVGDMSPMGLLWTFMGASPAYQMFAGFAEVLGGVLLFWRRTTLLGALILVGVLTHVVALNFSYDVPVKLFSTHLLAMALVLVAPHASRLADLLILNRAAAPVVLRPFPVQRPWVRRAALAAKVVLVLAYGVAPIVTSYQAASEYGVLAARSPFEGIYRVSSFARTDGPGGPATLADAKRWVRVAIGASGNVLRVQRADGTVTTLPLTLDTARRVWTTHTAEDGVTRLDYRRDAAGVITLEGTMGRDPVRAVLTPQEESLLRARGFRWISERPFNR